MSGDGYGRLISKAIWSGSQKQKISYEYDTDSNLSRQIYPDGGYIEYDYRELSTNWNSGLYYYNTGDLLCRIYDRRNWVDNPYGVAGVDYTDPNTPAPTYSFAYYADSGNLKSYTMPDGIRIEYGYDQALNAKTSVEVFREEERIYYQNYEYNQLGQLSALTYLNDPNSFDLPEPLAELFYDDNGNREFMYYDQIPIGSVGEKFRIQYGYNSNNYLTSINSLVYHFSAMQSGDIDGGGKLLHGAEYVYNTGNNLDTIIQDYSYNMRGELTDWQVDSGDSTSYLLDLAGNIDTKTVGSVNTAYGYNGDLMTAVGSSVIEWDENGQIEKKGATDYTWDYSGRLRTIEGPAKWLECRYGPDKCPAWQLTGIYGETSGQYKRFIYDTNGQYPVLLAVLDENSALTSKYYWVNGQNVAVETGNNLYYNIHDRLGSIRQVIDTNNAIVNRFDYDPYGKTTLEDIAAGCNYSSYHRFAGYKWEPAAGMYNCNARWYDPELMRFISRDPVRGHYTSPLTLQRYLYCMNSPVNRIDPTGKFSLSDTTTSMGMYANTASTAYDVGSSAMDYAKMVVNGVNLSNILLSVAIDVGMDVCGGKLFDALSSVGSKLMKGISNGGGHSVYQSFDANGVVQYVGRTNNFDRRKYEHFRDKGIMIDKIDGLTDLSYEDARGVEQALIERYGLDNLMNQRNGVSPNAKNYDDLVSRGNTILDIIGF